ncbi:ATP-binding protein [Actinokineospora sp. HUAS TT18]|uniref:ATP-binding protein n=1 Tax=Actinokineospora sp. HUAS TT18 TaxID=3447451 RepID=UPI003F522CFF
MTVPPRGSPADLTSFVGRLELLAAGIDLVSAGHRLVTMVGTGGVGKSRVALAVAERVAAAFADGVVRVDVADVRPAEGLLDAALAEALALPDDDVRSARSRLLDHLREKTVLLVVDNGERLVDLDGGGELPLLIAELLHAAPGLRVLATSRIPLGVVGERLVRVPPLQVSDGTDDHATTEALRLLIDRAAALDEPIDDEDIPLANELCRMLDGLPLAIELAAGRLGPLTLQEIVDRCENSTRLLASARPEQRHHQTLHATLRWSFDLLIECDQRSWILMSVFDGEFDLEAAEGVCAAYGAADFDVLEALARLIRASLLTTRRRGGRTWYRMLDVVRRFGHEVAYPDTLLAIRAAHASYYAGLAHRVARGWYRPQETDWIERLRDSSRNIRAAVDHFLSTGNWASALTVACDVTRTRNHINLRHISESRRLLDLGLNAHPPSPSSMKVSAEAMLAYLAMLQGNAAEADVFLARAEATSVTVNGGPNAALLFARGMRDWLVGQSRAEAATALGTLAAAVDALGDDEPSERIAMRIVLAIAAGVDGVESAARETTEAFWADVAESGVDSAVSWALFAKSIVELRFGTLTHALDLVQRCLRLQYSSEDTWGPAWGMWLRAVIAARMADHVVAARLFGAAHARHRATDVSVSGLKPWWRLQVDAERGVRRALGEAFDVDVAEGAALPYAEAMQLALATPAVDKAGFGEQLGVTSRQLQVARLVADGLTNKQIAARLTLSTRTIENHVLRTITSLGLSGKGRAGLAAWYAEHIRSTDPG